MANTQTLAARIGAGRGKEARAWADVLRPLFGVRGALVALSFIVSVLLLLSAGYALEQQIAALLDSTGQLVHSRDVELQLSRLQTNLDQAESAVRGYVITGERDYLLPFDSARDKVAADMTAIRQLVADDPRQQAELRALAPLIGEKLRLLQLGIQIRAAGLDAVIAALVNSRDRGRLVMDEIRARLSAMSDLEEALLTDRRQQSRSDVDRALLLARTVATAGILLLSCAFAWLAVSMHLRGMGEQRAIRLAESLEQQRRQLVQAIEAREAADRVREQRESQLREDQIMVTLGRLAAGLAHVLNNALTVIMGNAELVESLPGLDKDARSWAKDIKAGAEKASELTDQFRSFGQRQMLEPEPIDLNQAIEHLGQLTASRLRPGIVMSLSCEPGSPTVVADRGQLMAALAALVENAAEAMPAGGSIRVGTRPRLLSEREAAEAALPPGHYAEILVVDTGRGMSEEVLRHAFEPFYTTKDASQGAGLGLSMVHGFVRQSGGQVGLRSQEGKGTEVCLLLPVVGGSQAANPPPG